MRDLPGELRNVVESWQLTIPDDGQESHTVRYLPLEVGKKYKVYAKQDGSWKQLSTETIGSYLPSICPGIPQSWPSCPAAASRPGSL